jgi:porphobilinogen synthase
MKPKNGHPGIIQKTGGGGGFITYMAMNPQANVGAFVVVTRSPLTRFNNMSDGINDLVSELSGAAQHADGQPVSPGRFRRCDITIVLAKHPAAISVTLSSFISQNQANHDRFNHSPPPPASIRCAARLFEETTLSLNDLVLPIFVEEEIDDYKAIEAMPGVMRIPEKYLAREIERIANAGIRSVMTFGISHHTDATGSDTWNENGLVARMSRICKSTVPEMIVMSDTCFCEYTSHGHCGVLCDHGVDNDATLENLGKQAVVAAAAGADFIAPSAAMDGQVQAIRRSLDAAGFTNTAIMSYSTKFASSFYGPFREAPVPR